MTETIRWWLVLQLAGLVLLPLCLAMFRRLPDRGYALSKPFALLLLGFAFWFLNSLRILPNSSLGIVLALAPLAALAGVFAWRERDDIEAWAREHWRYIVGVEVLLLMTFVLGVWLRSTVGEIRGTEQPMDLMFLNAVTRADHFPPEDPWLSGHTVAYYYFGYLIVGMVGRLAGVATDVGYNIGLAMIASLSFVGAFGLVYNLVRMHENDGAADAARAPKPPPTAGGVTSTSWRAPVFGIAGGLMLVVMGNLVWVLMFASSYGIGGKGFYRWVDIDGLTANEPRATWYPSDFFGFFNASRIYPLNNQGFRAITEFPMFSFLLGDLHPHVMALPFVLLVAAVALTLYRSEEPLDVTFWLQRPLLLLGTAIMLGAMAFINTWDIATMSFVVMAAAFVSNFGRVRALTVDLFVQTGTFALPLILLALLVYVPFFASFASQADGLGAVVTRPGITVPGTRPLHLLLYWGPLFAIVLPYIATMLYAERERITTRVAGFAAAVPMAVIVGWALLFGWQRARGDVKIADAAGFGTQIGDRGSAWLTAIFVGLALAAALLALWLEMTSRREADTTRRGTRVFVLLLASTALLLILGTEFFYVGDVFNNRMNTVFKLYYQGWLLLAVVSGFGLYELASRWQFATDSERRFTAAWGVATAIVLVGAALYPLGGAFNRARPYGQNDALIVVGGQLSGISYVSPDERQAIDWLRERAQGQKIVIAEATGGDYSEYGRISAATGVPTILGWGGHEDQWRGSSEPRAGRFEDVNALYQTTDMATVRTILQKYGVTYIYVGELERRLQDAQLAKFQTMPVAFTSEGGSVTIYSTQGASEVESAQ